MKNPATSAEFFKRYGAPRLDFSLPARMTLPGAVAGRPSALRPSHPAPRCGVIRPHFRRSVRHRLFSGQRCSGRVCPGSAVSLLLLRLRRRWISESFPRAPPRRFIPTARLFIAYLPRPFYFCFRSDFFHLCQTYFTPTSSRYFFRFDASMLLSSNTSKIWS